MTNQHNQGLDQLIKVNEELFSSIRSPSHIQNFLDSIPYSTDPIYRCPAIVIKDKRAHCFDGAVFAAAALAFLGFPPLILQLRAVRDDDHLLSVFKVDQHWGAVGKSNCAGLRFREPIFRSLRELVLSYFEFYFNIESEKTLRAYSVTLDLTHFNHLNWIHDDKSMDHIAERLDRLYHYPILSPAMIDCLCPVDQRTYEAGMLGADEEGLYKP